MMASKRILVGVVALALVFDIEATPGNGLKANANVNFGFGGGSKKPQTTTMKPTTTMPTTTMEPALNNSYFCQINGTNNFVAVMLTYGYIRDKLHLFDYDYKANVNNVFVKLVDDDEDIDNINFDVHLKDTRLIHIAPTEGTSNPPEFYAVNTSVGGPTDLDKIFQLGIVYCQEVEYALRSQFSTWPQDFLYKLFIYNAAKGIKSAHKDVDQYESLKNQTDKDTLYSQSEIAFDIIQNDPKFGYDGSFRPVGRMIKFFIGLFYNDLGLGSFTKDSSTNNTATEVLGLSTQLVAAISKLSGFYCFDNFINVSIQTTNNVLTAEGLPPIPQERFGNIDNVEQDCGCFDIPA